MQQQVEAPAYEIKGRTMSLEEWDLKVQTENQVDFKSLAFHRCDISKYYEAQGLVDYFKFLNGPTYQTLVRHFWVILSSRWWLKVVSRALIRGMGIIILYYCCFPFHVSNFGTC
ncbi:hypothetical protein MtrunA17_Chr4g0023561 [Medicago truncatula]|uniref:Uncharacterized protein n=1 Tax=Medicago truncatula TaxID=3880 RepID=A0A396I3M9_MEDTR|nr:hypothetical protein MtrunA17_Chr4g0023561 [Medicago truncatula]